MARYTGAVCRLCRREGKKLFLKGEISFLDIERINFETVKAAKNHFVKDVNLDVILESDKWASETASQLR